ncbi:UNVERIFIED_CONTAM: hypothetical protein FKN15_062816 [Acipenser sinensis]
MSGGQPIRIEHVNEGTECGVRTTHCNTEVVRVSRVLFLAVKPRIIPSILQEVSAVVTPQHIIVSVAAGVTVATLEQHPAQLRADVCTPRGTTIFGLHALERGGLRAAAMGAVDAVTERACELGGK